MLWSHLQDTHVSSEVDIFLSFHIFCVRAQWADSVVQISEKPSLLPPIPHTPPQSHCVSNPPSVCRVEEAKMEWNTDAQLSWSICGSYVCHSEKFTFPVTFPSVTRVTSSSHLRFSIYKQSIAVSIETMTSELLPKIKPHFLTNNNPEFSSINKAKY